MGEISGPEFQTSVTDAGFVITASLPSLRREDLEIVVEGWTVRIRGKRGDSPVPFEAAIHVPSDYSITAAQVAYLNNELRITIPKSAV
jgi:HSP20 family molecular chaperone IbpA